MKKTAEQATMPKVRGVRVTVDCTVCVGKGWVKFASRRRLPGPEDHELVRCPLCNGRKVVVESITLEELAKLLGIGDQTA